MHLVYNVVHFLHFVHLVIQLLHLVIQFVHLVNFVIQLVHFVHLVIQLLLQETVISVGVGGQNSGCLDWIDGLTESS